MKDLEAFLQALTQSFQNFRVLVYGSFISDKSTPIDIDVMVYVIATPIDPGFAKFTSLQPLASSNVDVFPLKLSQTFESTERVPDAAAMVAAFSSLEAHVKNGIKCTAAVELVLESSRDARPEVASKA